MNEKKVMNLGDVMKTLKVFKNRRIYVKEGYDDTLPVELARGHGYTFKRNEIILNTIDEIYLCGPAITNELYRHLKAEMLSNININEEAEIFIDDKKIIGTETFMSRPLYFYFIVEKNEIKEDK